MKLAASILFDASYLEPALVTAHELLGSHSVISTLYLVYLEGTGADDSDAKPIIELFCNTFDGPIRLVPIALQNSLTDFQAFHFNNSIIYKALIPSIIHQEPYVLNIDAGIIPGCRFDDFIRGTLDRIYREPNSWVIAAHCHEPEGRIPPELRIYPRNRHYPAGNLLLFNTTVYHQNSWHERFLHTFMNCQSHLEYAEQELICLTAQDNELLPLPQGEYRCTPFLGLDVLLGKATPLDPACVTNSLFFKFVGSLKPWKYWVLDPNKSLYTQRRSRLEQKFPLSGLPLIERHRTAWLREDFCLAFLKAYDAYIEYPTHSGKSLTPIES